MVSRRHVLPVLLLLGAIPLGAPREAGATERTAPPRLCPEDAPEGVRLPARPDCGGATRRPASRTGAVHDIGGVQVRVGGRVGAEFGVGR